MLPLGINIYLGEKRQEKNDKDVFKA